MIDEDIKHEETEKKEHSIRYLLRWLKSARKAADTHWKQTRAAYAEYNKEVDKIYKDKNASDVIDGWYGIYHSSCKTMEPAYYARTPKLTTNRPEDTQDIDLIRRCTQIERLGNALLKKSGIDETMRAAIQDYIHADKASLQVIFEGLPVDLRMPLNQVIPEGSDTPLYYSNEDLYEDEVFEDEDGYFYNTKVIKNPKIYMKPLPYDEVLHNPEATTTSEITMMAYKFCLSYDEALDRFGEDKVLRVKEYFKASNTYKSDDDEDADDLDIPGKFIEGYEIYCIKTNMIYWVCEDYKDDLLDSKEYALGLEGFFPSPPFRISSKPPKNLYPTPEYIHLKGLIEQLHEVQSKMFRGIKTIERKILVDGAEVEVIDALKSAENVYIACKNLASIIEKGGIDKVIVDVPVREFVQAISEFTSLKAEFKNEFFEHFGVPDILRGISDATETAAAQEIKQGAAYDRFRYNKKQLTDLARDGIEMMIDLALKMYPDEKLAQIMLGNLADPVFQSDLAFLRNDEERTIRIDIETDSTNFTNEAQQVAQKQAVTQTLVQGMQQISQMLANGQPEYAAVSLHALTSLLDSMPGGKSYVNEMKGYTQQLIQKAMQPPPAAPPPPDYEQMKISVAANKAENENIRGLRELDQKQFKLELDAQQQAFDQQIQAKQSELNERIEQAYEMIEFTKIELEKMRSQVEAANKAEDNKRMESQQILNTVAALQAKVEAPPQPTTPAQPIAIHLNTDQPFQFPQPPQEPSKPKRKKIKVVRTPDGGLEGESVDIPETPTLSDVVNTIVSGG